MADKQTGTEQQESSPGNKPKAEGKLLFMKDDADVAEEFNKEPMVVGCCACAVGA